MPGTFYNMYNITVEECTVKLRVKTAIKTMKQSIASMGF